MAQATFATAELSSGRGIDIGGDALDHVIIQPALCARDAGVTCPS